MATKIGSNQDDILLGTSGIDFLVGRDGNDKITSGAGSDIISGGAGNDIINSGSGADFVDAGSGDDVFIHNFSDNINNPKYLPDIYMGGSGTDTLRLELTADQAARTDIQTAIKAFNESCHSTFFNFSDFTYQGTQYFIKDFQLSVINIEKLEVKIIGAANQAPVANADSNAIVEGATTAISGNVLLNDTDADNNPLVVSQINNSAANLGVPVAGTYGSIVLNANGTYSYALDNSKLDVQALAAGQTANDVFSYQISDGNGGVSSNVLTIKVTGLNDAPVLANAISNQFATEDSGFSFQLASNTFADVDNGDSLTYTATLSNGAALPAWLSFNSATRTFSGTPSNSNVGTISVTVTAKDNSNASASGTFNINVANTNDSAVIGLPTISSVTEDSGVNGSGNLVASGAISITDDDAGEALFNPSVISAAGNLGGLVLAADGSYTYSVANSAVQSLGAGATKSDSFTISSVDGTTKNISFTINGVNDAPIANANNFSVLENGGVDTSAPGVLANDVDVDVGDSKTVTSVSNASSGLKNISVGSSDFINSAYGTLTLFSDGKLSFTANGAASDALAAGVQVVDTFTYTMRDAAGATSSAAINITITGVNDAPTTNNVSASGDISAPIVINLSGSDVDGIVDHFVLGNLPGDGIFYSDAGLTQAISSNASVLASGNAATIYFVPTPGFNGTINFNYSAVDNNGLADASPNTVSIAVNTMNEPPHTFNISAFGNEDAASIAINLPAVDPDGTVSYFVINSVPGAAKGFLYSDAALQNQLAVGDATSGATVYFVPSANFNGIVNFTYSAVDNNGAVGNSANATITVFSINDAPILINPIDNQSVSEGDLFSFQVPANAFADIDVGDSLTYSATLVGGGALPSWLQFDASTRTFSGTPAGSDVGTLHVVVTATDGSSATISDNFDINIAATTFPLFSNSTENVNFNAVVAGSYTDGSQYNALAGDDVVVLPTNDIAALIAGYDAKYTFNAGDGNDQVYGGELSDIIDGGVGNDTLVGGDGNGIDTLSYVSSGFGVQGTLAEPNNVSVFTVNDGSFDITSGFENITGSNYDDNLNGNSQDNFIVGAEGNDVLQGGDGNDTLFGGNGNDNIFGGVGDDTLDGGTGNNVIDGGSGIDTVRYIDASGGIIADLSNNTVDNGSGGVDSVTNVENVIGSSHNDKITGNSADNSLYGSFGDDEIHGGDGNDNLYGGTGSDQVYGENGNDVIYADAGIDFLDGGAGIDTINLTDAPQNVYVNLNDGHIYDDGFGSFDNIANFENIIGPAHNDIGSIPGASHQDILIGSNADNIIIAGKGDDLLEGLGGNDTLDGGAGSDTAKFSGVQADYSFQRLPDGSIEIKANVGSDGTDTLSNIENIQFSDGTVSLNSIMSTIPLFSNQSDTVNFDNIASGTYLAGSQYDSGTGNDVVYLPSDTTQADEAGYHYELGLPGGNFSNPELQTTAFHGGDGNDTIIGSNIADQLYGDTGNDTISGGLGFDLLYGGDGIDAVSYANANNGVYVSLLNDINNPYGFANNTANSAAVMSKLYDFENITGSHYADTLIGNAGDNVIDGNGAFGGFDYLDGAAGVDTVSFADSTVGVHAILNEPFASPNDVSSNDGSNNLLATITNFENITGSAYNDNLYGNTGDNLLVGGGGNDLISSGNGNDVLIGGVGVDQLDGGLGSDTVSYADINNGVYVTLNVGFFNQGYANDTANVIFDTNQSYIVLEANYDTLNGIENIIGSNYNDTLIGDGNNNIITGGLGSDVIDGGAGIDTANYSDMTSGVNVNLLNGTAVNGADTDTLSNIENVNGSSFDDFILSDGGNHNLDAGNGFDTISYSQNTSAVNVNLVAGTANTNNGIDTLSNFEKVIGSDFADSLTGDNNDVLVGGAGNDTLQGNVDNTTVAAYNEDINNYLADISGNQITLRHDNPSSLIDEGTDTLTDISQFLFNGVSFDQSQLLLRVVNGTTGDDTLATGAHNGRELNGLDGNDTLTADSGSSNTKLNGGAGNDSLINNGDNSNVAYYAGKVQNYSLSFLPATQIYTVHDLGLNPVNEGTDTTQDISQFNFNSHQYTFISTQSNAAANNQIVVGADIGNQIDTLNDNGFSNVILMGNQGNDALTATGQDNMLIGGNGNDTLTADTNSGNIALLGGAGDDTLTGNASTVAYYYEDIGNYEANIVSGLYKIYHVNFGAVINEGTDTLTGITQFNFNGVDYNFADIAPLVTTINGTAFADNLNTGVNNSYVTINALAGNDTLHAENGSSHAVLNGGSGNDALFADDGSDSAQLNGGEGDDILSVSSLATNATAVYSHNLTNYSFTTGVDLISNIEYIGNSLINEGKDVLANITQFNFNGRQYNSVNTSDPNASANSQIVLHTGSGALNDNGFNNVALLGGDGDQILSANGANTLLIGGAGDDSLNGSVSSIAGFSHTIASYDISSVVPNQTLVSYVGSGVGDGNDTLNNQITHFIFADNQYNAISFDPFGLQVDNQIIIGTSGGNFINATANNQAVLGGAGNDQLSANFSTSNALLVGGAGDDQLSGNTAIAGYAHSIADYTFANSLGQTTVNFIGTSGVNEGTDTLLGISNFNFDGKQFSSINFNNASATADNQIVVAQSTNLFSNDFDSVALVGSSNDNFLQVSSGSSGAVVVGGAGNDNLVAIDPNSDATAAYSHSISNYDINTSGGNISVAFTGTGGLDEGTDTLQNISHFNFDGAQYNLVAAGPSATLDNQLVIGTANNDSLTTNGYNNVVLSGGSGDDQLIADSTGSTLLGGSGDDTLTTISSGSNTLVGGLGSDNINISNGGSDVVAYNSLAEGSNTEHVIGFAADDKLDLSNLLTSMGYNGGSNAFSDGYLNLVNVGGSTQVQATDTPNLNFQTITTLDNIVLTSADINNFIL